MRHMQPMTTRQFEEAHFKNSVYALLGMPLGHSASRCIHHEMLRQNGLDGTYVMLQAEPDELNKAIALLRCKTRGFNVTIPYKTAVMEYCDTLDDSAVRNRSVNTVSVQNGLLQGYNTDVDGFVDTLRKHGVTLAGSRVLLVGAGGSGGMIARECIRQGAELEVISKSFTSAERLCLQLKSELNAHAHAVRRDSAEPCDVIINASPAGMTGADVPAELPVPDELLKNAKFVLDIVYNPLCTPLLSKAEQYGISCANGVYMLLGQAAAAQRIWQGSPLDVDEDRLLPLIETRIRYQDRPIVLAGFMGCGKTTTGERLAQKLDFAFSDTDQIIEQQCGQSISEIFKNCGEQEFRQRETEALEKALKYTRSVISVGGGTILQPQNLPLLKKRAVVVFLDVSLRTALDRLRTDTARPLIAGGSSGEREEKIAALYHSRRERYRRTADYIICADEKKESVAGKVIDALNSAGR